MILEWLVRFLAVSAGMRMSETQAESSVALFDHNLPSGAAADIPLFNMERPPVEPDHDESSSYHQAQNHHYSKRSLAEGELVELRDYSYPVTSMDVQTRLNRTDFAYTYETKKPNRYVSQLYIRRHHGDLSRLTPSDNYSPGFDSVLTDFRPRLRPGRLGPFMLFYRRQRSFFPTLDSSREIYAHPYRSTFGPKEICDESPDEVIGFEVAANTDSTRFAFLISKQRDSDDEKVVKVQFCTMTFSLRDEPDCFSRIQELAVGAAASDAQYFDNDDVVFLYEKSNGTYWQQFSTDSQFPTNFANLVPETLVGADLVGAKVNTFTDGTDQYMAVVSVGQTDHKAHLHIYKNKQMTHHIRVKDDTTLNARRISKPYFHNGELVFGLTEETSPGIWSAYQYRIDYLTGQLIERPFEIADALNATEPFLNIHPVNETYNRAVMLGNGGYATKAMMIDVSHIEELDITSTLEAVTTSTPETTASAPVDTTTTLPGSTMSESSDPTSGEGTVTTTTPEPVSQMTTGQMMSRLNESTSDMGSSTLSERTTTQQTSTAGTEEESKEQVAEPSGPSWLVIAGGGTGGALLFLFSLLGGCYVVRRRNQASDEDSLKETEMRQEALEAGANVSGVYDVVPEEGVYGAAPQARDTESASEGVYGAAPQARDTAGASEGVYDPPPQMRDVAGASDNVYSIPTLAQPAYDFPPTSPSDYALAPKPHDMSDVTEGASVRVHTKSEADALGQVPASEYTQFSGMFKSEGEKPDTHYDAADSAFDYPKQ